MPVVGLFDVFQRRCCLLPNILIAITAASKFHLKRKKEEREREKKRKKKIIFYEYFSFPRDLHCFILETLPTSDKNVKLRSNFTFLSPMRPKP
jgi:hypothetical protein